MTSLFLGTAGAVRLEPESGPNAVPVHGWWGKDSRPFVEEVLTWLARR